LSVERLDLIEVQINSDDISIHGSDSCIVWTCEMAAHKLDDMNQLLQTFIVAPLVTQRSFVYVQKKY
jgi:hypothetical protein